MTTLNSYIQARADEAKKKRQIANPIIVSNCKLPFATVLERVNAAVKDGGFSIPLNENYIRDTRHKVRKQRGLPYDGLDFPDMSRDAVEERAAKGLTFALERLERGVPVTETEIRNHAGIGGDRARAILRRANALHRRRTNGHSNGSNGAQTPLPLPVEAPAVRLMADSRDGLSPDALAAVQLLTESLATTEIVSLTVVRDGPDKWHYEAGVKVSTVATVEGKI